MELRLLINSNSAEYLENSSEYSEVDHDIVERYVVNAHNNPPVNHDPFLTESILHVRPEGALLDRIREHMHRYDVIEYDAIWTLEDGSETADWESHREETLRSLILPEIRYTVRNKPGDKFSFGVAKPVIEALSTLTAPDSRDALLGRIETWQLVMTGGWDSTPITESVTTNMLLTYYAHLVDLGAALVGSPRSFTCLVTTVFGFPYNNVCLLIPSYHIFRIPAVVEAVRRWMRAPALSFAVQNAPRDQFPYNVELRAPGQDGAEEEVDPEGEREIARVIYTLDVARIGTHFRENLPTLDIIDILLSNECPGPKNLVIRRIRTIQDTITAANEETESLDNYTAEDLDAYCAFWTAILHALRVFVESGASTSARLSECTMELIHGGETAFELAFPTMRAFHSEALGWWLLWVEKTLVPQLKRVSGLQCSCTFHERQPRNQEDQPEQN
ncbi:hypothetical protein GCK72_012392 [Caenorhabditis remanei]|uniref:Uncharacterized protein n=1 Tax=Caenorhabditis remanei TaxID=31234 RepID=A0A6A5GNH2_CAERE|nr:hypothetical protein GCK72_012392 [Caenorhabditis remanei]KAF1755939.1 hypothetical protein GCK72_012392 [Caenorhabditis remanei]